MADAATKSIIGDKYKGKYKGSSDWIGDLIVQRATKVPEGAKEGSKKTELYLPDLFALARANKLDETKVAALEAQQSQKNAPGRIRMTLGNMLRAAARKRHGLYDVDGTVLTPDALFMEKAQPKPTEDLDGNKIVDPAVAAAKAEKAAQKAASAAAVAEAKPKKEKKAA